MIEEQTNNFAVGYVTIRDKITKEILLECHNSIHYENLALTIARALADRADGHICEMHFGNGAATVSGTGAITYFPPNTTGRDEDLYNDTYYKVIDPQSSLNTNTSENNVVVSNLSEGLQYADIVMTCTLDVDEPAGQAAYDDATDLSGDFIFNELGIKAYSSLGSGKGLLLTHVIFHPVQKSLNRIIEILYTLRISMY